jgi:hypothetical protein
VLRVNFEEIYNEEGTLSGSLKNLCFSQRQRLWWERGETTLKAKSHLAYGRDGQFEDAVSISALNDMVAR